MKRLVIGLDFGSDSVRALLTDAKGNELASSVAVYPRWSEGKFCDPGIGKFRQHPKDYLESMTAVIREVMKGVDPEEVAGIALDTTGSTPCAVDSQGIPLALQEEFADDPDAMFVLWKDHTAIDEEIAINRFAAENSKTDYRKYEGGIYSCEWYWSKYLHILRHDPAIRAKTAGFVEHCDWITGELTGNTDPVTMRRNRCAAGHKAMWHADWGGLPPDEFFTGIDPLLAGRRDQYNQQTHTVDSPAGKLSAKWAEILGLNTGVVVGGCALDCHMGAIGAGICAGEMVKVLGTSTCDILAVPPVTHCIAGICGQVDGSVLPGMTGLEAGQSAFGDIYAWFKRFLGYAGEVSLDKLEADAAAIAPGATAVKAVDWFNGRRTPFADAMLTGAIAGLNLGTTAPMVYRALVESTLLGSKAILEHYLECGLSVNAVTAVGGISNKSPFIMQMCADILNVPVKVAKTTQACALGSAMVAAAASGLHGDLAEAMQAMSSGYSSIYTPRQEMREVYDRLYLEYRQLGEKLESLKKLS